MSFGLDIENPDGEVIEVVDGHTYNLSPMWRKALPDVLAGGSTSGLDGRAVAPLLPHLDKALLDIHRNGTEYRKLNPPNGWGNFQGFQNIFCLFVELCHANPHGVVRWNG